MLVISSRHVMQFKINARNDVNNGAFRMVRYKHFMIRCVEPIDEKTFVLNVLGKRRGTTEV